MWNIPQEDHSQLAAACTVPSETARASWLSTGLAIAALKSVHASRESRVNRAMIE